MDNMYYTISEQIADKIRRKIISGEYKEGMALREIDLANTFNVSRGPVRDALKTLSIEGFAIAQPNIGVKVAPHPSEPVLKLIIDIRKQIETFALTEVFDSITEDDIIQLKALMEDMKKTCETEDIHKVEHYDIMFHRFFVEKYPDNHMQDLWHNVINRMMFKYDRPENLMELYEEHEMILDMIISRNKNKAIGMLMLNIQ